MKNCLCPPSRPNFYLSPPCLGPFLARQKCSLLYSSGFIFFDNFKSAPVTAELNFSGFCPAVFCICKRTKGVVRGMFWFFFHCCRFTRMPELFTLQRTLYLLLNFWVCNSLIYYCLENFQALYSITLLLEKFRDSIKLARNNEQKLNIFVTICHFVDNISAKQCSMRRKIEKSAKP